jgi:hypothetical protein
LVGAGTSGSAGAPRFGSADATARVVIAAGWAAVEPTSANYDRVELVGRPLDERLAAWCADRCEAWSQTTFYLFDPESWR